MKTALIFGVTGQDGSYLAEFLLDRGYAVVGVRRRTSLPNDGRVAHLLNQFTAGHNTLKLVAGDVSDAGSVHRLIDFHRPAEIYNLAAQSQVRVSFDEPAHTADVVYGGCLNILEAVRQVETNVPAGTDRMRVYQASSSEMFGSAFSGVDGNGYRYDCRDAAEYAEYGGMVGRPFQDEHTPMLPCSPYGIAKLAAHHLVRVYRESYGVFACSGILYNHESERRPEQFVTRKITRYAAEFSRWWKHVRANEPGGIDLHFDLAPGRVATVRQNRNKEAYPHRDSWICGPQMDKLRLGNLDASRDWGHAEDYVRGMWLMLQRPAPDDYVLATGETHTVREFLHAAFAAVGCPPDIAEAATECDKSLFRPSEVDYLRGDATKARDALGWTPAIGFDELVRRMVAADLAGLS